MSLKILTDEKYKGDFMINFIKQTRLLMPVLAIVFLLPLGSWPSDFLTSAAAAELSGVRAPYVISTIPRNHAGGVLLNSKISATFSRVMNPKTFTRFSASVRGLGGTHVAGTISFNADNSVFTFTPANTLATGTKYIVTFTRRVKSSRGIPLLKKYSFSFITIGDFIYSGEGNGRVSSWSISGGKLSYSPVSTGSGSPAGSVAIDPSGKYLYAVNLNNGTVSSYSINNGILSSAPLSTTTQISGFTPYHLAVDPMGRFVYVTDWNNGTVSSFSINNGQLSSDPVSVTAPTSLSFKGAITVVVDPSGNYLYVDGGMGDATDGFNSISSYSVSGGILTLLGGDSNYTPKNNGLVEAAESIVQSGNLLFVAEDGYDNISSYAIKGGIPKYTGNSTPYETSSTGIVFLAVDPSGRYLFASENNPDNIISYSIGPNGALTQLSKTAIGYGRLANPNYIIVDPSGRYLYVTYYSTGNLAAYSIKDGMLSADPVSQIGSANAMIAGDYTSIAITPSVYKSPEWPVSRLPVVQSPLQNNTNTGVKKVKNGVKVKPIFNFFQNLSK